jgi:hypothetical protein
VNVITLDAYAGNKRQYGCGEMERISTIVDGNGQATAPPQH